MIKAKVVSVSLSAKPDALVEMNIETYIHDNGLLSCPDEVVIMTEEEYKDMDSVRTVIYKSLLDEREKTEKLRGENDKLKRENNEKEGEICKLIVNNDVEQARLREEIKKLEEENKVIQKACKNLEEKLSQEASEVYLCPDGTLVFRTKKVSELEKEVEKLKAENKALKEDKFTMKITGGLFYKED